MSAKADQQLAELIFDHLCDEQPEAVAELRDPEILRRVHLGIDRARTHDLDSDGAITAFVTLMFLVAPNFDQHPRIRKALDNPSAEPDQRIQQIFERTAEADWDEAAENACSWDDLAE
ncbi:MAG: hypothetical protein M9913_18430 [Bryobacteraceae bacterium]|nr:hypothetical protein [Solibacteraceae bacterium]MCO5352839.1 hypothetical protein [Bryobacteraceae bacterium]